MDNETAWVRCDAGGQWKRALEIFGSMDAAGLPRDAITYSSTISALAKGKQWSLALQARGFLWRPWNFFDCAEAARLIPCLQCPLPLLD